jgi:hypothetical protein
MCKGPQEQGTLLGNRVFWAAWNERHRPDSFPSACIEPHVSGQNFVRSIAHMRSASHRSCNVLGARHNRAARQRFGHSAAAASVCGWGYERVPGCRRTGAHMLSASHRQYNVLGARHSRAARQRVDHPAEFPSVCVWDNQCCPGFCRKFAHMCSAWDWLNHVLG